ncbi:MAG: hypothetical protein ETSY1_34925 [Candidatus Entotheonella factor]|uniref:Sulfatase-modifying factor enzyme-like domain-containing protein n=1 Tax=Entotheonella factor TaxID=1429438 RepID=W4L8K8_ENTF1|nr:MAG: hypothetical protein ETSY1_34925 [Candidatus Entotheonella factor]
MDIYAFGVMAIQLLAGDITDEMTLSWRRGLERRGVPIMLLDVIEQCVEEPDNRLADAGALASALSTLTLDASDQPSRPSVSAMTLHTPQESQRTPVNEHPSLSSSFTNSIGMEFVLIPAGTFIMGSPDSDWNADSKEKPAHQVTITHSFYLSKYLVTQRQWESIMGENPSNHIKKGWFRNTKDFPVESVSWQDVQSFLYKLSQAEEGRRYRLPTEAEWEYACRAGSTTAYSFGEDVARLDEYAWYSLNADHKTHRVGQKKPNAWGLYDMHGNVCEWVRDWLTDDYSQHNHSLNPQGPTSGTDRVTRGGSFVMDARHVRSATRGRGGREESRATIVGFRCLRDMT